jgi:Uma2 family endonuclease
MSVSQATYERVALEDPEGRWELSCRGLRRKPDMTLEHNDVCENLVDSLLRQLPRDEYRVRWNSGRVRVGEDRDYIPDVMVVPVSYRGRMLGTRRLETYADPLPLVVEVWSRSTGDYDVREKLEEYKRRGDREIWLLHPYERTLTAWRRQADGSYEEHHQSSGEARPVALPSVTVNLEALFS